MRLQNLIFLKTTCWCKAFLLVFILFPALTISASNDAKDAQTSPNNQTAIITILDLKGDGIETIHYKNGAYFDHDGNGFAEQTGWASSDDGILVRDINSDGVINDGKELFGNETLLNNSLKAANGFEALKQLDSNNDNKIDSADAAFAQLKVWQDTDGDGYSSTDELKSLSDAGVASINTGYTTSTTIDANGNEHKQVGSFTKTDGSTNTATDVWFKDDNMYTIANDWLDVRERQLAKG